MIRPTQTAADNIFETDNTWKALRAIEQINSLLSDMRDVDNADLLKRALSDTYDNATARWAELTSGTDDTGDDLISDQELALAADRRADAKAINAENQRMR